MTTCGASLLTRGYVTLHILGSASIYWSLLPFTGFLALLTADRGWPSPKRVDDFFCGYLPWMIWLTAAIAIDRPGAYVFWEITAVIAFLASGWLDRRLFATWWKYAVFRLVSILLWFGIFGFSWPYSEAAWRLSQ
jgi:hypothetical protein